MSKDRLKCVLCTHQARLYACTNPVALTASLTTSSRHSADPWSACTFASCTCIIRYVWRTRQAPLQMPSNSLRRMARVSETPRTAIRPFSFFRNVAWDVSEHFAPHRSSTISLRDMHRAYARDRRRHNRRMHGSHNGAGERLSRELSTDSKLKTSAYRGRIAHAVSVLGRNGVGAGRRRGQA